MSDIILHHYDLSPYAEKIRLILGFKGLAWKSVQIPMVMPKPDLTCLTGGYRKTPVLQIGADIYCDTKTIACALERVRPQPTLFPANTQATERAVSSLADAMFLAGVGALVGANLFPQEFIDDRKKMFPGGFDIEQMKKLVPAKLDQMRLALASLDAQLSDGRHFLLGDKICLADFSVYNPVSFLSMAPITAALTTPFKHLEAWRGRMAGIGHGTRTEISADEAIAIARDSTPVTGESVAAGEPNGYKAGDRLSVMPEDYGRDAVVGELVAADPYEIALKRRDPRVGEVVVHFPRQGYLVFRVS
jgi:glutathione S-transferase